jgi:hypothetical protein
VKVTAARRFEASMLIDQRGMHICVRHRSMFGD